MVVSNDKNWPVPCRVCATTVPPNTLHICTAQVKRADTNIHFVLTSEIDNKAGTALFTSGCDVPDDIKRGIRAKVMEEISEMCKQRADEQLTLSRDPTNTLRSRADAEARFQEASYFQVTINALRRKEIDSAKG
jgi:hypothetical protein